MTTGIRNSSGDFKSFVGGTVRDSASALRTLVSVKMRDADNVLRTVLGVGGLTVNAYPTTANGYGSSPGSINVTTNWVTAVVEGGTPPYTYAWVIDDTNWAAVFPTSQSTPFRSPLLAGGDDSSTTAYAEVTDSLGLTGTSNTIDLYASNFGG